LVNSIILPQLAWYGTEQLTLGLPESWQVEICNMAGYNRPKMKSAEIRRALANPRGMRSLSEYARGIKEVAILFDDMTRVTRVKEIVPHVLAGLAEAGIQDQQIRFVAALGCHGAMDRVDFVKKLGEDILKRFPVYNHSPFDNCIYAGTTTRGTRLLINAEVMKCDLKIGIGSIVPHTMVGFSGGGKIGMPGVAAYETVLHLHASRAREGEYQDILSGMGTIKDNPRRADIDEAAAIIGLDMKIDAIVNGSGETVALYAGAPAPSYALGLEAAKKQYLTVAAKNKDIVIANTFAKAGEAVSGLLVAFPSVKPEGGDVVLIANAPEGQATHYLMGPFGDDFGGRLQLKMNLPTNINRVIIYSKYPELTLKNYIGEREKVVLADDWADVIRLLEKNHGPGTRVAVYPNTDIQYCAHAQEKRKDTR
jgi:nickel-dependent lactate racemase